jgi:hypothetical protein
MPFLIDAWFEKSAPSLRILDRQTGVVLREWDCNTIEQLCENGEICMEDFYHADQNELKRLVSELFLCGCIDDIKEIHRSMNTCSKSCSNCKSDKMRIVIPFPGPPKPH